MPLGGTFGTALAKGVGSGLASGFLGKAFGGGRSAGDQVRTWIDQSNYDAARQWDYSKKAASLSDHYASAAEQRAHTRFRRQIQDRVSDARAAGLHPLFALGAAMGHSPTFSTGVAAPSSSGISAPRERDYYDGNVGQAFTTAFQTAMGAPARKRAEARAERLAAAQVAAAEARAVRDTAEATLAASEAARADQIANQTRTYGLGVDKSPKFFPLEDRYGRKNKQMFQNLRDPKSGRKVQIYSEDAQADELNQVLLGFEALKHTLRSLFYSPPLTRKSRSYRRGTDWVDSPYKRSR